ncbi:hypothetical protein Ade02nite_45680 [Paractinoplanes deccanensis]|uniref:Tat pathway signal sequence domain protein n=1 Tax=Paractinoplanes deccanensis TaxID=113561 RepID=A0ABQ3Y7F1_9ACTN|nr:twin-arginine translocation signal domain-containing protein [Actinoplanes deccanensis]GID75927.1 hypothetical protein Ade02nite_45680 [Actinoplanes deccanensis]
MERRKFLAGAAAVAAGVLVPGGPAEAAYGDAPIVSYDEGGGFVPAGYEQARPPQLVVYRDGTAIADAEKRLRLRGEAVDGLLRHAVRVLREPGNGKLLLGPGDPQIADAPTSHFEARWRGRTLRLDAYALTAYREFGGYAKPTYDLYDELMACRAGVRRRGVAHRPDAVRLVAVLAGGGAVSETAPWPAGVVRPSFGADDWWSSRDLRGQRARAVVRGLPRRDVWDWRSYRLPDGRVVSVTWRRLLPHE